MDIAYHVISITRASELKNADLRVVTRNSFSSLLLNFAFGVLLITQYVPYLMKMSLRNAEKYSKILQLKAWILTQVYMT